MKTTTKAKFKKHSQSGKEAIEENDHVALNMYHKDNSYEEINKKWNYSKDEQNLAVKQDMTFSSETVRLNISLSRKLRRA